MSKRTRTSDSPPVLDRRHYRTLSFDCYGTLIDWERGILDYLQPLFQRHDVHVIDAWVLETFAGYEPDIQAGGGSYREVLERVLERFARRLAFTPDPADLEGFGLSIARWPPFPDSAPSLRTLGGWFTLIALSNIDDELFAASARVLGDPFEKLISAERIGAYKPDRRMFEALLDEAEGPVLHVAQSRYHDIVPATALGIDTVWINRPSIGATLPAEAAPTWTFDSLAAFTAAWH